MNHLVGRLRKARWRDQVAGLFFAAPLIVGFVAFTLYPFAASAYYSFTDFSLLDKPHWRGLRNYEQMLKDAAFHKALSNNAYMIFVGIPLYVVWALFTALLLNLEVRGRRLFRTLFFLPAIMPSVAASYVWLWVLNPRTGPGYFLNLLGVKPPLWYNDPQWAKPGLILFWFWAVGFDTLIFLAALQGVPEDLHEAADLDGANRVRRAISIDLPLISPAILFVVVTGVIWALTYFTQAFIVSSSVGNPLIGGRESSLLFLSVYIYGNAFQYLKMGYASAMAWVLFLLNGVMTVILLRVSKGRVFYG